MDRENDNVREELIGDIGRDPDDSGWIDRPPLKSRVSNLSSRKTWILGCVVCALVLIGIFCTCALIVTLFMVPIKALTEDVAEESASSNNHQSESQPRNIILMISDGLGPASVSFARTYYQYVHNLPYDYELPLDTIHVGQSRTRSSSTLVTDSAAGATAFSCAMKTYNRAIGVDPNRHPCGTILEAAKHQRGMLTGLVATSRITHATPASFSAHVTDRDDENQIAIQQIGDNPLGRSLDLMFGGGSCHFIPKSQGGCRSDERQLLVEASSEKYGWKTILSIHNRTAFDEMPIKNGTLPAIALFSESHMAYEVDRDASKEPSLTEMAAKALKLLTVSDDNGFFLMIEGSRIDMAAHSNDPVAHLHDILEYQETVALVKAYVDEHPDTLLISTSDHETGGLSLALQVSKAYPKYLWYPDVVARANHSTAELAKRVFAQPKPVDHNFIVKDILESGLGITDPTEKELSALQTIKSVKELDQYLAEMISLRAQLGWATHGHSAVDVNLYAYGKGAQALQGSHENIDIGGTIARALSLNLTDTTRLLNMDNPTFQLADLTEEDKKSYTEHLDRYHSKPGNLHHKLFT